MHAANHDPLTRLPNRAMLLDLLRARLTQAEGSHPVQGYLLGEPTAGLEAPA